MIIEADRHNGRTKIRLTSHVEGVIRLISMVPNNREDDVLRIYHAFPVSQINYVAPMLKWRAHERPKLNTLIRKSIIGSLGSRCVLAPSAHRI